MAGPVLLVLAKHAEPHVDLAVRPSEWSLTAAGVAGARRLGDRLAGIDIDIVVSSLERKAIETAREVAGAVGATFQTAEGLHEHERAWVGDRTAFEEQMRAFFADAGAHTPVEQRFTRALDAVVAAHRGHRLCVVAHGTVISLHLAARYGVDAWATWASLQMPSYVVVELRTKTIVEVVVEV